MDDSDASSEFKHSDSVECYLDRCEQKELEAGDLAKGLCSSDSSESMSSQSGLLSADEELKVKRRAYVKLRERSQNCTEESEQSGGEAARQSPKVRRKENRNYPPHPGRTLHRRCRAELGRRLATLSIRCTSLRSSLLSQEYRGGHRARRWRGRRVAVPCEGASAGLSSDGM